MFVFSTPAPDPEKSYWYRRVTDHVVVLSARPWVIIDADVTIRGHICATVRTCFARFGVFGVHCRKMLCWTSSVRWWSVDLTTATGVPETQAKRLQSVLNAAARLVFSAWKNKHLTLLLRELHWLKIKCLCLLVCSGVPLSERNCSIIPGRGSSFGIQRQQPLPMFYIIAGANRPSHPTRDTRRSFPVAAARAWNSLPISAKTSPTLPKFRKLVKTLFIFGAVSQHPIYCLLYSAPATFCDASLKPVHYYYYYIIL
jgi:hypothetical protein